MILGAMGDAVAVGIAAAFGGARCLFGRHTTEFDRVECARCGRWKERQSRWFWDEWRGSIDDRPVMFIKRLVKVPFWYWKGKVKSIRLDLHMFVRPDDAGCFHSHPAWAIRFPYAGGYVEEVYDPRPAHARFDCAGRIVPPPGPIYRYWLPLSIGIIAPTFAHRVSRVLGGASFSLWLRGPICADVQLLGDGWPLDKLGAAPERN